MSKRLEACECLTSSHFRRNAVSRSSKAPSTKLPTCRLDILLQAHYNSSLSGCTIDLVTPAATRMVTSRTTETGEVRDWARNCCPAQARRGVCACISIRNTFIKTCELTHRHRTSLRLRD